MVEPRNLSETKPTPIQVIQIPAPQKRRDDSTKDPKDADDADEPWICRGRD